MVPFSVQDAPDVFGYSRSAPLETESLRLTLPVLDRVGFQLSLPTLLFHLTHYITMGSLCQAGYHVRRFFTEGIAHHFRFPNPGKGRRKFRAGDPGGPSFKMTAESFMNYLVDLTGEQIKCPWASYITLAYGNFASLKKKKRSHENPSFASDTLS